MITLKNPLPPVLETFYVARDAIRVARRIIPPFSARDSHYQSELFHLQRKLLDHTVFPGNQSAKELLDSTEQEIADLFVLNLWVAFERFVRIYLQQKGIALQQHVQPSDFGQALYRHFDKEVDFWDTKELLDNLLKIGFFNTDSGKRLIGVAKQIYDSRNWIAHKNPKKLPPAKISPKTAYDTLNEIVETLLQHYP